MKIHVTIEEINKFPQEKDACGEAPCGWTSRRNCCDDCSECPYGGDIEDEEQDNIIDMFDLDFLIRLIKKILSEEGRKSI